MENKKNKLVRGFTLAEMMVAISIASLIMLVVIFSYRAFNDRLSLTTAQQEISISIRQAQVYGISVKGNSTNTFDKGYGIYIDKTTDNKVYYIFVDLNGDKKYTSTYTPSELIEKGTLRDGVRINTLENGNNVSSNFLSIMFNRPNPDAWIYFGDSPVSDTTGTAKIGLISSMSTTGYNVTVKSNGQISVK